MEETIKNLAKAFVGESQARNRYTFYAKIAKKEGYLTAEKQLVGKRLVLPMKKLKKLGIESMNILATKSYMQQTVIHSIGGGLRVLVDSPLRAGQ